MATTMQRACAQAAPSSAQGRSRLASPASAARLAPESGRTSSSETRTFPCLPLTNGGWKSWLRASPPTEAPSSRSTSLCGVRSRPQGTRSLEQPDRTLRPPRTHVEIRKGLTPSFSLGAGAVSSSSPWRPVAVSVPKPRSLSGNLQGQRRSRPLPSSGAPSRLHSRSGGAASSHCR